MYIHTPPVPRYTPMVNQGFFYKTSRQPQKSGKGFPRNILKLFLVTTWGKLGECKFLYPKATWKPLNLFFRIPKKKPPILLGGFP